MRKKPIAPLTLEQRNAYAREWLKQHDLFNIAALCRRINYNRGAFSRFEEGHLALSIEPLERLEEALNEYGYDQNLFHY